MKKVFSTKVVSFLMAVVMLLGGSIPAYAADTSRSGYLNLGYGEAKYLTVSTLVNHRTYIYIGTIKLPNDARVHRIIYKAAFVKSSDDAGIGSVDLKVQFRRNGSSIYDKTFTAGTNDAGVTGQQEVTGVSMGQEIEVWLDASSTNPAQSNGNIRSILVNYFEVYTD